MTKLERWLKKMAKLGWTQHVLPGFSNEEIKKLECKDTKKESTTDHSALSHTV